MVVVGLAVYFGRDFFETVASGGDYTLPLPGAGTGLFLYLGLGLALLLAAAAVFGSWYFTRYIIDEAELRIDTGMVYRQSKRIPFTKVQSVDVVQPALARIVGLAELSIDAGPDSSTRLRYLTRDQAYRFRDYLLIRAHGQRTTVAETEITGGVLEDIGGSDEILVRIGAGALLIAALLSAETIFMVLTLVVAIIALTAFGLPLIGLAGVVPFAFGLISHLNSSLFSQFNYTLARSGPGLKITRGLTSLTSQAVPRSRIQGVRITQWLPWRPFGLYRVDMELLGAGNVEEDGGEQSSASSILVPAGTADEVRTALDTLWPGVTVESVELIGSPARARRLRPLTGHLLRHGTTPEIAVVSSGRFRRVQRVVPVSRLQSVGITQGPIQRALSLADVHLHTAGTILGTSAKHLDAAEARRYALELIELSRMAGAPQRPTSERASRTGALGWPRPVPVTSAVRAPALGFPLPPRR